MTLGFDPWSIVHFASGFVVAVNLIWQLVPVVLRRRMDKRTAQVSGYSLAIAVGICLALSVGWEFFEAAIERWQNDSAEPWFNRWITDHVCVVSGAAVGWLFHRAR